MELLEAALLPLIVNAIISKVHEGNSPDLLNKITAMNSQGIFAKVATLVSKSPALPVDQMADQVLDIIRSTQRAFNRPETGLPDDKLLEILRTAAKCIDPTGPSANARVIARDAGENVIRIFVDGPLPSIEGGDARTIINRAWRAWSGVCNLEILQATGPDKAEVIMKVGRLDGASGAKLAEADVGPPAGLQLTLVIDESEEFAASPGNNKPVFLACMLHEIGHLLGLSHETRSWPPGSVMYPMHQPNVLFLTPLDIEAVQEIWGEPTL